MPESTYQDAYPALLADALRQGKNLQQFADDIGIKHRTVRRWLEIKPELRAVWDTRDDDMFRPDCAARFEAACKRGLTIVEFADEENINRNTFRAWVQHKPEIKAVWAKYKRTGRKTTFKPEYCEMLVEAMGRGLTLEEFAKENGLTRGVVDIWLQRREDFREARKRGVEAGWRYAQSRCHGERPRWQNDPSVAKAFWAQVDKNGPAGCWLWMGNRLPKPWDYGQVGIRGENMRAHRVAVELQGAEIPEGQHVCHTCDVPACVNPAHLYVGSAKENTADILRRGRWDHRPGMKNAMHKLTDDEVREMRKCRAQGWTLKELSGRFGVSDGCVSDICKRHSWRHLSD